MDTLQPRPLVLHACGLFWIYLLLGLPVASPARTDVGVQPIPPGGSNIRPEEDIYDPGYASVRKGVYGLSRCRPRKH